MPVSPTPFGRFTVRRLLRWGGDTLDLTHAQQLTTLGNGVHPNQAVAALHSLLSSARSARRSKPPPATCLKAAELRAMDDPPP